MGRRLRTCRNRTGKTEEALEMSDTSGIDAAQFSLICPRCGASATMTVGDLRPTAPCPGCAGEIDLTTDEVKHARQAAAAKASIQAHQDPV